MVGNFLNLPTESLTLALWLDFCAIAALICSSGSVEGEGGLVTTALDDWVATTDWFHAGSLSVETSLDGMEAFVPLTLIFRESSGELEITLADASSARAESVGALDVFGAIIVGDEVESVAEFFTGASSADIAVFFVEASVALLEVLARSIDVILGLSVSTGSDVVRAFWKTVATVVAVSSEKLFLLEPEDDDLELSEFSHGEFVHSSKSFQLSTVHEVHDELIDFVNATSGDISKDVGVKVSSFLSREGVGNISSGSAESHLASKSSDGEKVEKLHFFICY